MIHQEMRQVNDTLQRSQSTLQELKRMQKASVVPVFVTSGVLVETSGPWVLVGLPFGKLNLEGTLVWSQFRGSLGKGLAWGQTRR